MIQLRQIAAAVIAAAWLTTIPGTEFFYSGLPAGWTELNERGAWSGMAVAELMGLSLFEIWLIVRFGATKVYRCTWCDGKSK